MATIGDCLQLSRDLMAVSSSPRLDTEVLLAKALGKTRTYLYTWPEHTLTPTVYQCFLRDFEQRRQGRPIAYIVGEKEFWSLPILVDQSTLIPRSDTELLVTTALSLEFADGQAASTVADLGTGSGAIAIALASERPQWKVYAIDKSTDAIRLAKQNCQRLQVSNITLIQSDWLTAVRQPFDLIVSNPPYIAAADEHLRQGDVRFEPKSALIAAGDGLADIEAVIRQSYQQLLAGGWLLLEHGYRQAAKVRELLRRYGFSACFVERDSGGNERVSGGRKA